MSLVPCNVCGTLNSEEAEICLSCEYPIHGRKRSPIFQWAAVLLFLLFITPMIGVLVNRITPQRKPNPAVTTEQTMMNAIALHSDEVKYF